VTTRRKPNWGRLLLAVLTAVVLAFGFNYLRMALEVLLSNHNRLAEIIASVCFAVPLVYWVFVPIARETVGVKGDSNRT
jgi:predicted PurR-regulated permease PerM